MWTKMKSQDSYVAEASDFNGLDGVECPKCKGRVTKKHHVKTDRNTTESEIYGWHYRHDCGAALLIVND